MHLCSPILTYLQGQQFLYVHLLLLQLYIPVFLVILLRCRISYFKINHFSSIDASGYQGIFSLRWVYSLVKSTSLITVVLDAKLQVCWKFQTKCLNVSIMENVNKTHFKTLNMRGEQLSRSSSLFIVLQLHVYDLYICAHTFVEQHKCQILKNAFILSFWHLHICLRAFI